MAQAPPASRVSVPTLSVVEALPPDTKYGIRVQQLTKEFDGVGGLKVISFIQLLLSHVVSFDDYSIRQVAVDNLNVDFVANHIK